MLNYLWFGMVVLGILYGALTGNMANVGDAAFASAADAIELCITMAGVMAFWVGIMTIAQRAGIIESVSNKMTPLLNFLFPDVPKEHPARTYIATNMIANVLGLGWAATPAGLKAMEEMEKLAEKKKVPGYGDGKESERKATPEMCDFLIINISSLQLIPVNMIAYRSQYGSANPTAIIAPAIIATLISTLAAVVFCKGMRMFGRRRGMKHKN